MSTTKTLAVAGAVALSLTLTHAQTASTAAAQAKPDALNVTVTVKYTGKGAVDAKHKLWVWLFDHPDIGPGSMPIAEDSVDKNGGTVSFSNVTTTPVYIAVAYDEAGGFAGQSPPPPGSPIAIYGVKGPKGEAQPVTPGAKGVVAIAFDETQRMQ